MKRLLSIFIVVMMIFSSITVMAETKKFSDVADDYEYKTAIYSLVNFGILKGDADADTFRPTAGISREEFSVIMVRCLGLGSITVDITEYPFSDVNPQTCDDWSINATKIAYDQGIIKGMGDGTFAPKEQVTYEQAVKMIVCALGYEHHAIAAGGWPTGYLNVGRDLGITKKAESPHTEPAPRGIIAQLIYNSLEIDLMTPFIDSTGVQKYSSTPGQNLLTQKLGLTKESGVVTAIQNSAIDSNAIGVDADEVKINYVNKFNIGTTNVKDYLGQSINYYYKVDDGEKTLVSVLPTNDNHIYSLASEEVKSITPQGIEYYEDVRDTSSVDRYELNTPCYMLYNGAYAPLNGPITIESGSVKLIDNDGDGSINVIVIDSSITMMVSAVDPTNYIVYDEYDQSNKIELNPNSSDVITITKDSKSVDFLNIKKGDVLLYSQSSNPTGSLNKTVKIITNTVTGIISQISSTRDEVVINNAAYKLSAKFLNYIDTHSDFKFSIDNQVKCYLNENNTIIAAEVISVAATSTFKYGYLVAAEVNSEKENAQFRIFSEDGKMVVFTVTGKIKINNHLKTYNDSVDAIRTSGSYSQTNKDSNFSDASEYNICQLVKYSTNSRGILDSITTLTATGDPATDLVLSRSYTSDKYSRDLSMLGNSVFVNETTKVFYIPSERTSFSSYSVKQKSSLINNKTYEFEAYNTSSTNVAPIVVVYGNSGSLEVNDPSAPLAIVDTITQVASGGNSVNKLVCYQNGTKTTYTTTNLNVLTGITTGDIIRLQFDTAGYVSKVKLMHDADSTPEFAKRLVQQGTNSDTMNAEYLTVYGSVYGRDNDRMTVSLYDIDSDGNLDGSNLYSLPFAPMTKYYIYDTEKTAVSETTVNSIAGYTSAKTGASKIFAYAAEGITKLIMIIK